MCMCVQVCRLFGQQYTCKSATRDICHKSFVVIITSRDFDWYQNHYFFVSMLFLCMCNTQVTNLVLANAATGSSCCSLAIRFRGGLLQTVDCHRHGIHSCSHAKLSFPYYYYIARSAGQPEITSWLYA